MQWYIEIIIIFSFFLKIGNTPKKKFNNFLVLSLLSSPYLTQEHSCEYRYIWEQFDNLVQNLLFLEMAHQSCDYRENSFHWFDRDRSYRIPCHAERWSYLKDVHLVQSPLLLAADHVIFKWNKKRVKKICRWINMIYHYVEGFRY